MVTTKAPRLLEPTPAEDVLCSGGLQLIEDLGFGARFVVCAKQTCYEEGVPQIIVVGKLVFPWEEVWPMLCSTANFMASRAQKYPGVTVILTSTHPTTDDR